MKLLIIFFTLFLIPACSAQVSNLDDIDKLNQFLVADKTDQNEWKEYYSCGHYVRDLVESAESQGILLGGALVSNHPVFRTEYDYNTHILNYVYVKNEIVFIDAQTDELYRLSDVFYIWEYVKLYMKEFKHRLIG